MSTPIDHIEDIIDPLLTMDKNFLLKFVDVSFEKLLILFNLLSGQSLNLEMKHINFGAFVFLNTFLIIEALRL